MTKLPPVDLRSGNPANACPNCGATVINAGGPTAAYLCGGGYITEGDYSTGECPMPPSEAAKSWDYRTGQLTPTPAAPADAPADAKPPAEMTAVDPALINQPGTATANPFEVRAEKEPGELFTACKAVAMSILCDEAIMGEVANNIATTMVEMLHTGKVPQATPPK